jgi:hypothetical protein
MAPRSLRPRRVEACREETTIYSWLEDDGDYVRLERRRRPIELEPVVGVHRPEPERARRKLA